MNDGSNPNPAAERPPVIDSRTNWVHGLLWGFEAAIADGARQIVCVDPDFASWPLDDTRLHNAWAGWLRRPQRRLVLLAAQVDEVPRRHPRFMAWRRHWVHALSTLVVPEERVVGLPQRLLDDGSVSVQLFDATHWRGRAERNPRTAHALRLETDVLLQQAAPALALNVLGI